MLAWNWLQINVKKNSRITTGRKIISIFTNSCLSPECYLNVYINCKNVGIQQSFKRAFEKYRYPSRVVQSGEIELGRCREAILAEWTDVTRRKWMTDRSSVPRIGVRWLIIWGATYARCRLIRVYRYVALLCQLATDATTNCRCHRVPLWNTTSYRDFFNHFNRHERSLSWNIFLEFYLVYREYRIWQKSDL